jgi:hypothetical protein
MKIFSTRTVVRNPAIIFFTFMPNPGFIGMRDLLARRVQQQISPRLRRVRNDIEMIDTSLNVSR